MPFYDDLRRYVVLQGNRRLTALKALENPEWLIGAMQPSEVDQMRGLSRKYQDNPIESLLCIVVSNREEARHWTMLRGSESDFHTPSGRYTSAQPASTWDTAGT